MSHSAGLQLSGELVLPALSAIAQVSSVNNSGGAPIVVLYKSGIPSLSVLLRYVGVGYNTSILLESLHTEVGEHAHSHHPRGGQSSSQQAGTEGHHQHSHAAHGAAKVGNSSIGGGVGERNSSGGGGGGGGESGPPYVMQSPPLESSIPPPGSTRSQQCAVAAAALSDSQRVEMRLHIARIASAATDLSAWRAIPASSFNAGEVRATLASYPTLTAFLLLIASDNQETVRQAVSGLANAMHWQKEECWRQHGCGGDGAGAAGGPAVAAAAATGGGTGVCVCCSTGLAPLQPVIAAVHRRICERQYGSVTTSRGTGGDGDALFGPLAPRALTSPHLLRVLPPSRFGFLSLLLALLPSVNSMVVDEAVRGLAAMAPSLDLTDALVRYAAPLLLSLACDEDVAAATAAEQRRRSSSSCGAGGGEDEEARASDDENGGEKTARASFSSKGGREASATTGPAAAAAAALFSSPRDAHLHAVLLVMGLPRGLVDVRDTCRGVVGAALQLLHARHGAAVAPLRCVLLSHVARVRAWESPAVAKAAKPFRAAVSGLGVPVGVLAELLRGCGVPLPPLLELLAGTHDAAFQRTILLAGYEETEPAVYAAAPSTAGDAATSAAAPSVASTPQRLAALGLALSRALYLERLLCDAMTAPGTAAPWHVTGGAPAPAAAAAAAAAAVSASFLSPPCLAQGKGGDTVGQPCGGVAAGLALSMAGQLRPRVPQLRARAQPATSLTRAHPRGRSSGAVAADFHSVDGGGSHAGGPRSRYT